MAFSDYIVLEIAQSVPDTFVIRIKPTGTNLITPFSPGQYVEVKNPRYTDFEQARSFSIASSPNNSEYLELCVKTYGNWTKKFVEIKQGDLIKIAGPLGNFFWDNTDRNAVFLVGGNGIAPIISMLRFINEGKYEGNYLLLYGNRTQETIVYKQDIELLTQSIKTLRVVNIFSDLQNDNQWKGYHGFITDDILKKEVNFSIKPIFFIVGPEIFINKMKTILQSFNIPETQIKAELL